MPIPTHPVAGITKYVNSSMVGKDTNSGDDPILNPWKTVQHGVDWFAANRPPNTTCTLILIGQFQENVKMKGDKYSGITIEADPPVQPHTPIEDYCESRPQIGGDAGTGHRRPGTVFSIDTVKNLTLRNLTIVLATQGILAVKSDGLTLDNCCIHGHAGGDAGGGFLITSSNGVNIIGCRIFENQANRDGGGGCVYFGDQIAISGCDIYKNTANRDGGGLYLDGCNHITVTDCQIGAALDPNPKSHIGPNEGGWGGGISTIACQNLTIDSSGGPHPTIIDSNKAAAGGGVYVIGDRLAMQDIDIVRNKASIQDGGGLHVESWKGGLLVTLTEVRVQDNESARDGGGLYVSGKFDPAAEKLTLNDCTIANNRGHRGGGLFIDGLSVNIQRGQFNTNEGSDGGGLFCTARDAGKVNIVDTTFDGNDATGKGGAGHLGALTRVDCLHAMFTRNNADQGGALSLATTSANTVFVASVAGCTFTKNTAGSSGGGCFLDNLQANQMDLHSSTYTGNQAGTKIPVKAGYGGGMTFHACDYPYAAMNVFTGNTATAGLDAGNDIKCEQCTNVDVAVLEGYNQGVGGKAPDVQE